MVTNIYIQNLKFGTKFVYCQLLVNNNNTVITLTPSATRTKSSLIFRSLYFIQKYMSKDVVIIKHRNLSSFSILPILNYKPSLGKIMTKEEKAISELNKKKGSIALVLMPKAKESQDPYVTLIDKILRKTINFKELNHIKDNEIYFYSK